MTNQDRAYLYNAEVKHVAECLYTIADVCVAKDEITTFSDLSGNFSGYDEEVLHNIVSFAKFNFSMYFGKNAKRKMREFFRQEAARLVAEAAAKRGYLVYGDK